MNKPHLFLLTFLEDKGLHEKNEKLKSYLRNYIFQHIFFELLVKLC